VISADELEWRAAGTWRAPRFERLGDWLLRAADGFTGRANSALALGDPGVPLDAALDYVTGWYRARGLPAMIAVPLPLAANGQDGQGRQDGQQGLDAELTERAWATRPGPAFVMVADLPLAVADLPLAATGSGLPAGAEVAAVADPDAAWLARYHYRGTDTQPPVMREVLTSAQDQAFISIRTESEVLAIARLSIADGWAGLTAVEVNPDHRRAGLGLAITAAACAEAVRRDVGRVFLQVEVGNAAARALYERCGFRYSHRYHYRMAPD
jgi:ribosomal protein S18 acetylase RimI-like enzyme